MKMMAELNTDHSDGRIYQLTHEYSRMKSNYYAVRMELCSRDFNYACAYIQLIRDALPSLPVIDDCIGEVEAFTLLQTFYGAVSANNEECGPDDIVDLHENWNSYVCPHDLKKINAFAVPNASYKMLEYLIADAQENLASSTGNERFQVEIERLKSLLTGAKVQKEWGWQDIYGQSLTGFCIHQGEAPELLIKQH